MALADQSWYIESAFGTKRSWVRIPPPRLALLQFRASDPLPGRGFAPFQSAAGAINALDHAKELKQYAVKSRDIRENGGIFKGYLADDLSDPWGRYLTDEQPTPDSGATSAT
jgi:hypothetical protein